jgi:ketosteroid isomerase-like protein
MPFEGPIEDRIAIRERIESYGDAVFQRNEKAWAANWAEDSVWNLGGMEVSGKSNIVALWRQAMAGFSYVSFFGSPGAIRVEGNSADARVYTLEFLIEAAGKARRVVGQYDDQLVKQNGQWLFRARTYRVLNDA